MNRLFVLLCFSMLAPVLPAWGQVEYDVDCSSDKVSISVAKNDGAMQFKGFAINENGEVNFPKSVAIASDEVSHNYSLYVGGQVGVKGVVYCEELKVDPKVVPDYVFEQGYKLRDLHEVEAYVNQHGHLPGVPSAEEVKRDGLGLAQMQMTLLEKVEELTLYVLQQQKEIEQLKKENKELKNNKK